MSASRFVYTLLLYALLPRALVHLWWRARRQPAYREHIGERFGRYAAPATCAIDLGACGVGRRNARRRAADHASCSAAIRATAILLTHMTPTGRETGQHCSATAWSDAICLTIFRLPSRVFSIISGRCAAILLETEIWPNLIHACHARERSALSRERAAVGEIVPPIRALSRVLPRPASVNWPAIAAQSRADAGRLQRLGAPAVAVTGNLKFDIAPDPALVALGAALAHALGPRAPGAALREHARRRGGTVAGSVAAARRAGPAGRDRAAPSAALRRGGGAHRARGIAYQRRSAA